MKFDWAWVTLSPIPDRSVDRPFNLARSRMFVSRLHQFLTASLSDRKEDRPRSKALIAFWLSLSLAFALYYSGLGQWQALTSEFVIQDDTREYVFWMQRFIDPGLLPNDLIAAYFKSITPPGYAAFYHLMANLGIAPLPLSKVLPIGLGAITTLYGFGVSLQLFPIPAAGFLSMLLLNQSLWFRDDLSSATPRAFVYPLLLAFLYYLLCNARFGIVLTIVLQALIYPPLVLVTIGILFLRLWKWQGWKPRFQKQQMPEFVLAAGFGFLALLPYSLASGEFGPTVTAAQAWQMPELHAGGRHPYFDTNLWRFWVFGQHSGIVPRRLAPALIWIGLLLPIAVRHPDRFPLVSQIQPTVKVLWQMVVASLGLFLIAHGVLLKLFFPARYTTHTFRVAIALAAGIVLMVILDALFRGYQHSQQANQVGKSLSVVVLGITLTGVLMFSPHLADGFLRVNNRIVKDADLHEFFRQQPKHILIATLSEKGNDIPTFSQRSILTGREYALPFHLGYYRQIQQRTTELLQAQYSPDLAPAQQLIQKYGIDFWLLDRSAFSGEYLPSMSWLQSFQPAFHQALSGLQQGAVPAIAQFTQGCAVFENRSLVVLDAKCMIRPVNKTS